jgi:hypothetical protein
MVLDAEPLPDQRRDARGGPELGGEAELARHSLEPGEHLPLLFAAELGRGPGVRDRVEGLVAPLSGGGDPTANAPIADAEDAGHFGDGRSVPDSPDGAPATPYELLGTSVWSHAREQTRSADCRKIKSADRPEEMRTLAD